MMAIDLDNKFSEIMGELVYCKKTVTGMYHSGIKFVGNNEQVEFRTNRLEHSAQGDAGVCRIQLFHQSLLGK